MDNIRPCHTGSLEDNSRDNILVLPSIRATMVQMENSKMHHWKPVFKRPIVPSTEEIEQNHRSRSAKLRVAERTEYDQKSISMVSSSSYSTASCSSTSSSSKNDAERRTSSHRQRQRQQHTTMLNVNTLPSKYRDDKSTTKFTTGNNGTGSTVGGEDKNVGPVASIKANEEKKVLYEMRKTNDNSQLRTSSSSSLLLRRRARRISKESPQGL